MNFHLPMFTLSCIFWLRTVRLEVIVPSLNICCISEFHVLLHVTNVNFLASLRKRRHKFRTPEELRRCFLFHGLNLYQRCWNSEPDEASRVHFFSAQEEAVVQKGSDVPRLTPTATYDERLRLVTFQYSVSHENWDGTTCYGGKAGEGMPSMPREAFVRLVPLTPVIEPSSMAQLDWNTLKECAVRLGWSEDMIRCAFQWTESSLLMRNVRVLFTAEPRPLLSLVAPHLLRSPYRS